MATNTDACARYRAMWEDEMAGAALYRTLAEHADEHRSGIFLRLAEAEERHAAHWAGLLAEEGITDLTVPRPSFRMRVLGFLARRFGSESVIPIVLRQEAADADKYRHVPEAPPSMAASEMAHGRALVAMEDSVDGAAEAAGERIVRSERRHHVGAGGALRASVFGVNDGLVSNLALVVGVAGGIGAGNGDGNFVLLAGVAGLVAGAFSMAAGEWVSVSSQRELYEREILVEAAELEAFPEEEREELALIYQAKGIPQEEAEALAAHIMERPETALDTMAREELGIAPGSLASARVAASSSFLSFALGAVVPVVPYMVGSGNAALAAAALAAAAGLFGVGALTSIFTARSAARAGLRMVLVGGVAATVTYLIGSAIGVGID